MSEAMNLIRRMRAAERRCERVIRMLEDDHADHRTWRNAMDKLIDVSREARTLLQEFGDAARACTAPEMPALVERVSAAVPHVLRPRDGWKMPEPPKPGLYPFACLIGPDDGWLLGWGADRYSEIRGEIPWPFADDEIADSGDMEAAGFWIVG